MQDLCKFERKYLPDGGQHLSFTVKWEAVTFLGVLMALKKKHYVAAATLAVATVAIPVARWGAKPRWHSLRDPGLDYTHRDLDADLH